MFSKLGSQNGIAVEATQLKLLTQIAFNNRNQIQYTSPAYIGS